MTIIDRSTNVQRTGVDNSWAAKCPAHDDNHNSLSVSHRDGKWLLKCHAGCSIDSIVSAMGIKVSDLFDSDARKQKANGNSNAKAWTLISEHVYRSEADKPFLRVRKYLDENGKKQYPQFHWDGGQWLKGKPKGPKIPYCLPQLLAAPLTATIYFVEGEKDADNLSKLGFIATTASEGAGAKWPPELTPYCRDRHVVVLPDADKAGRAHGQKVAKALDGIAASVKVVDLFPDRNDGSDVSDWLEDDRAGAKLAAWAAKAPLWEPSSYRDRDGDTASKDDDELIIELAALPKLAYAKRRKDAAKELGITAGELDEIVADARGEPRETTPDLYEHWVVEPWPEPVDGEILLQSIADCLSRYVIMSEHQATAVALWLTFTWLHEQIAIHSPILLVTSPQANSGKSTLLGVINFLARRSIPSVSISGPALFRSIQKWTPTFVLDEADTAFVKNEDLKEVANSGWTRGQSVIRCDPDTHEPQPYSTFAPKVLGVKGRKLPDTTLTRAIIIAMKRKRPDEQVDFDHTDNENLAQLRRQILRWTTDNAESLATVTPEIPAHFHNRVRANWKLLLAIAEQTNWKAKAQKAAVALEEVHATFVSAVGIELLADIKINFDARKLHKDWDRVKSECLVEELIKDKDKNWAGFNKGKPISQRQVAGLLREFDIRPRTVRFEDGTAKGYELAWFSDAFARYLSPENPISIRHTVTSEENQRLDEENDPSQLPLCDGTEMGSSPLKFNTCDGVTDRNSHFGGNGEDRTCAQCRGAVDGTEQLRAVNGGAVWLHRECVRFYVEAKDSP